MKEIPENLNITAESGSKEMDPRQKDSQGLDYWAQSMLDNKFISRWEFERFISKDNSKEKTMEERGLPQLKHYGFFNSIDEIRTRLEKFKDTKFIIRCSSKEDGRIKRLIDASLDNVCDFATSLPGGFEKWNVEVKEFVNTIAAGTITVSSNGRTNIETWHGAHYLNTTNCPKYHASFDPSLFDLHYNWSAPEGVSDLQEMQGYAIKALKYHFPYLRPKENEQIYIEYGVKEGGEIYFIEANDSTLLTG